MGAVAKTSSCSGSGAGDTHSNNTWQSFSSMLMVSSIRSGFAVACVVMYWYSDFLSTMSCESDAAQVMTCRGDVSNQPAAGMQFGQPTALRVCFALFTRTTADRPLCNLCFLPFDNWQAGVAANSAAPA